MHELKREEEGHGMTTSFTPTCSCGWRGYAEYAHNDCMWTNLYEQEERHLRQVMDGLGGAVTTEKGN